MALVADITKIVDELSKGGKVDPPTLAKLVEQIGKAFNAKFDEVAVLSLVDGDKFLRFIVPEKLQQIGNIPMTSTTALSVRTAREKRPEVINNFTSAKHTTVFEAVPLGKERGEPIQKIMSAPINLENKIIGVIQVSRKGKNVASVGPDFTPKDLGELVSAGSQIGRCLKMLVS
ncbi:MAG: GAF domain-containing protein [Acidobacteria bacterium]|nr:GAF domain-containing protein [Acidobacteriota bacterium]